VTSPPGRRVEWQELVLAMLALLALVMAAGTAYALWRHIVAP